jgi:CRP/FNR family transcriptional regulator, cyclic AMP receptor protein
MSDDDLRRTIAENGFFSSLAEKDIDFLAANAKKKRLADGKVLFHHGDPAKHFFLLTKGHLSLEIPAIEGPALQLQDIGPSQITGWSWLIPPNRWHFQARAHSAIEYLEFDGIAVLARCEAEPRFGYELVKRFSALMSERLDFARKKMMETWKPLGFA